MNRIRLWDSIKSPWTIYYTEKPYYANKWAWVTRLYLLFYALIRKDKWHLYKINIQYFILVKEYIRYVDRALYMRWYRGWVPEDWSLMQDLCKRPQERIGSSCSIIQQHPPLEACWWRMFGPCSYDVLKRITA